MEEGEKSIKLLIFPYEHFCVLGDGIPIVFVAVAGRSNGLGPVMSGNTAYPVVNCPPLSADWGAQDVWSSLRLPSGKRNHAELNIWERQQIHLL